MNIVAPHLHFCKLNFFQLQGRGKSCDHGICSWIPLPQTADFDTPHYQFTIPICEPRLLQGSLCLCCVKTQVGR